MTSIPPDLQYSPFGFLGNGDILILIFSLLPVPDIVRCRELSSTICCLIDDSALLQYKMELCLAGVEESVSHHIPVYQRRKLLCQYGTTHDTLDPTLLTKCPVKIGESEACCILQAGRIFWINQNGIRMIQLPSSSRGTPQLCKDVEIPSKIPSFGIDQVAMDASQDLLIVIQPPSGNSAEAWHKVRILSQTYVERHPLASHRSIKIFAPPLDRIDAFWHKASVLESKLVVLFNYRLLNGSTLRSLCVSDWKTGKILMLKIDKDVEAVSFLDTDHLLLVCSSGDPYIARLCVMEIPANTAVKKPRTVSLLFPAFTSEMLNWGALLHLNPTQPGEHTKQSENKLFTASPEQRIAAVEFHIGHKRDLHTALFVIPTGNLTRLAAEHLNGAHPDVTIPWGSWGPDNTRFLPFTPRIPHLSDSLPCIMGTRYFAVEEGFVVIYDFNPFAARLTWSLNEQDMGDPDIWVVMGSQEDEAPLFSKAITTSVPYRRIVTMLQAREGQSIGVDEDCVILSTVRCFLFVSEMS